MNIHWNMAGPILGPVVQASASAAVLAVVVLVLLAVLGRRFSARFRCVLWMIVLARLAVPFSPPLRVGWPQTKSGEPRTLMPEPPAVRVGAIPVEDLPTEPIDTMPRAAAADPAPTVAGNAVPRWNAQRWLMGIWLAGMGFMLLRAGVASARLRRMLAGARQVEDPAILELLGRCQREMGVGGAIRVWSSDRLAMPALVGVVRPRLVIPERILRMFETADLRMVILHELAHLRRRDVLANYLMALVQAAHWFNPAAHLAIARIRTERELACDELVLARSGEGQRRAYGETLLKLVELFSRPALGAGAVGILEGRGSIKRRIAMIATFERHPSRPVAAALGLVIVIAACLSGPAGGAEPPATRPARDGRPVMPARPGQGRVPLGMPGMGGPPPGTTVEVRHGQPDAEDAATSAMLKKVLPEVKFEAIALRDVIDFLRDVSGGNIVLDARAVEEMGASLDAPITLRLRNVTLNEVLKLTLRQVNANLRYAVEEGVIVIPPPATTDTAMVTRAYDVKDLIASAGDAAAEPVRGRRAVEASRGGFGGGGMATSPADERTRELVDLITSTIGQFAAAPLAVRSFNGKLIVTTNEATHREVVKILGLLREDGKVPETPTAPSTPPTPGGAPGPTPPGTGAPTTPGF